MKHSTVELSAHLKSSHYIIRGFWSLSTKKTSFLWRRDWESNPEGLLTPRLSKPLEYHYRISPWWRMEQDSNPHVSLWHTRFRGGTFTSLGESIQWRRASDSNGQFHLRSRTSNAVHYHSAQLSRKDAGCIPSRIGTSYASLALLEGLEPSDSSLRGR